MVEHRPEFLTFYFNRIIKNYQRFMWFGLFAFFVGLMADLNAVPLLRHFVILGPAIFLLGVFIWIPLRIPKPIISPYSPKKYVSRFDAIVAFLFNNFLMEWFGFCVGIIMLIVINHGLTVNSQPAFKAGLELMKKNEELKSIIGEFQDIGIMTDMEETNIDTAYRFSSYGSEGSIRVEMRISKVNNDWVIRSYWLGR